MFTEKRDRLIFGAMFTFLFLLLLVAVIWIINVRRRNLSLAEKEELSSSSPTQLSEEVSTYPAPLYTPSPSASATLAPATATPQASSKPLTSPSLKTKAIIKKPIPPKTPVASLTPGPLVITEKSLPLETEARAYSYAEVTLTIENQ